MNSNSYYGKGVLIVVPPRKKAVGYARVSSESQTENTSIELQIEKINDYCRLYDLELVNIFVDNGKTGSSVECRDGYHNMIQYVTHADNDVNAIIVVKADRIHRRLKNLLIMIEDVLQPSGTAFISITENFDTSTSQGMLFLQMVGSFGEFERKVINERTRSGRVKTAKDRQYAGGEPAYGYKAVKGELTIDDDKARVVKEIFQMYAQGKSTLGIADYLNRKGITSKRGKQWSRQTVGYIITNSCYIGTYSYNGPKERNGISNTCQIPSIISRQLWNTAQKRRSKITTGIVSGTKGRVRQCNP